MTRPSPLVTAGYWLSGALAAAYVLARAWLVPLTYDEAVVALRYMTAPFSQVFEVGSGTNHFLNTVLARLASAVAGPEPWAIRLPNVVAGVAYLVAMASITRRFVGGAAGLAGFVLLVSVPFLLDYFAVSRGYGLAIGVLAWSVRGLLRWCDADLRTEAVAPGLTSALLCVVLAVAASFTALPAAVGILAVVLVRLLWVGDGVSRGRGDAGWGGLWMEAATWTVATALFSLAVFSHDRELSAAVFDAVEVEIVGLLPDELAEVAVERRDAAGRFHPLERHGHRFTLPAPRAIYGLRIELPRQRDLDLSRLAVTIGGERFERSRRDGGPWVAVDRGDQRTLTATPALRTAGAAGSAFGSINMRGDGAHAAMARRFAGITVALLATIGLLAWLALAAAGRWRRVPVRDLRPVLRAGMAIAALCAAPAWLLRANNQLYFGGTTSVLHDTIGSLLAAILYTVPSWPGQGVWAVRVVAVLAALVVVAVLLAPRSAAGAAALAGVLAVAAVQVEAQHRLLGTPYLTDRTALFLLPLLLLVVVLSTGALASVGPAMRGMGTAALAALAGVAVWHAVGVATLTQSRDVPSDASTPEMLRVLDEVVAESVPRPDVVRLGVEWMYFPVAQYYASRLATPGHRYEVVVVPDADAGLQFRYCRATARCDGDVIATYDAVGAVLRRASP